MLIQSSLPSSIEAPLSFLSEHGKQDFLCDWMPAAETWQMYSKCDKHPQGGCRKAVPITEGRKNDDDSCSLNFPQSCSQLSTISVMSEGSVPNFVYQRRKLRRKHATIFSAQASADTKASAGCLSAVSSEAPSVAAKDENGVPQVGVETETVRDLVILPVECNREPKAQSIDRCSVREEHGSDDAPKNSMSKVNEFYSANDSCSSSKSNMELGSASMKNDVDDTAECSSSSVLGMATMGEDISEKDLCISVLRSEGLLRGCLPSRSCPTDGVSYGSDSRGSRTCKVCGKSEISLKILICDHCEEAFHMFCCNPSIKKIPVDEWFCHSCLKKTRKMLKETTIRRSLNINGETSRSRNTTCKGELGPIAFMLKDTGPYTTGVRIGKGFQAEVADWSSPTASDVDFLGEPLDMDPSGCVNLHGQNANQPSRLSSIGNWLQCREVIDGLGEGVNGIICGKWRRAPLFEVQTDDWSCFCCVRWDPAHSDCAVPQELETDEVLRQLKYMEMLRPRLVAKRRKKLGRTKSGGSQNHKEDERNTQTR